MNPGLLTASFGLATLSGATAALVRGIVAPRSQILAPTISAVRNSRRRIALTFDDGPSEATPALLDVLAKYRVRATFFVCGKNVKRLPHVARAIVEAGHELGNHTHHHMALAPHPKQDWKVLTSGEILREMRRAQTCIHHHTGVWPRYFRPPYGVRWIGVRRAQQKLGVQGVTWSVLPQDDLWQRERIASYLVDYTKPGGIVCLHDGRGLHRSPDVRETLAALEMVLPIWKARGFRIGTVHELVRSGARKGRSRSSARDSELLQTSPAAR